MPLPDANSGLPLGPEDASGLTTLVYDELRRMAADMLRGRQALTLQPTALVHEAYLKLAAQRAGWADERHFRAIASIAMRRVLADHVRARSRDKRGGGDRGVTLHSGIVGGRTTFDAGALHEAIAELEVASPRVAQLLVYRFFGDLTVEEVARRLDISVSTAEADWRFARAWLSRRLNEAPA